MPNLLERRNKVYQGHWLEGAVYVGLIGEKNQCMISSLEKRSRECQGHCREVVEYTISLKRTRVCKDEEWSMPCSLDWGEGAEYAKLTR